jgi:hypothetical protein
MNNRSSRSHAIFTISLEQRRQVTDVPDSQARGEDDEDDEDTQVGGRGRLRGTGHWDDWMSMTGPWDEYWDECWDMG